MIAEKIIKQIRSNPKRYFEALLGSSIDAEGNSYYDNYKFEFDESLDNIEYGLSVVEKYFPNQICLNSTHLACELIKHGITFCKDIKIDDVTRYADELCNSVYETNEVEKIGIETNYIEIKDGRGSVLVRRLISDMTLTAKLKCEGCKHRRSAFPFDCMNSKSEYFGDTRFVGESCEIQEI